MINKLMWFVGLMFIGVSKCISACIHNVFHQFIINLMFMRNTYAPPLPHWTLNIVLMYNIRCTNKYYKEGAMCLYVCVCVCVRVCVSLSVCVIYRCVMHLNILSSAFSLSIFSFRYNPSVS